MSGGVQGAAASASEPALVASLPEPVPVSAHSGNGQAQVAALEAEIVRQCGIGAGTFSIDAGFAQSGLWQISADLDPAGLKAALGGLLHDFYAAALLGEQYDKLLRSYEGPLDVLCDGDVAQIDAAYDAWQQATAAALAKARGEPA